MPRTSFAHHLFSVVMVALAALLRVPIEGWAAAGTSPIFYIPSITAAARYGGFGAGVVAVLLWATLWVCLDLPPGGSETMRSLDNQYRVVVFLLEGMILSGVVEALNAILRASDETAREMEQYRKVSGRNEASLRAILEHSSAPIWMKDLDGRYLIINPRFETLIGRGAIEVIGRTDIELSLAPNALNLSDGDRMALESGHAIELEKVIHFEEGPRTFLSVQFPLTGDGGSLDAIGGILTDITELKEAQRRAVQAERLAAIGQMMAGLAHESRNALQRGQACLEMLAFRLEDRPETLDLLAGIQESQDDLHRLYEEVRCYAAPIRLELHESRITDLLREAWDQLKTARRGREARLVEPEPDNPICEVDRRRLVQVFRNVMENALDACRGPARIVVGWSEVHLYGQPAIRMSLLDNGSGLTPEPRSKLFEPFFTTKTHGTGLGMAIARRIIEAHSGSIEVGSAGESGTEIVIILPRRQVDSPPRSSHPHPSTAGQRPTYSGHREPSGVV